MEYTKTIKEKKKVSAAIHNFVILFIIMSSLFIIFWFFLDRNSVKDIAVIRNQILLKNLSFTYLNVKKPKSFKENIKYIKLPNELEIILIESNNKELTKNSASVVINSEIDEAGISLLCQRSIILGSIKYPDYNTFNDLITSNEGHYDVYSKQDSTTFIYDINKEKFLESLDVFLHSFINPLFREELIRKELNLIKSEYKKYEQSPEIKFDNLFLQISNNQRTIYNSTSENKHHLFNITSDDQILRDYVLQHFNKHYVGRNMKIMIFGNFEVQNVEKLILNNLVKVQIQEAPFPNKINFKKIPDHSSTENVLFSFIQPKIVFYRSENNVLKVFFNIQNVSRDIKNYLTSYLKYIISSEYKNSLLHNLIKNKLVFNLKLKFFDRKNDLFSINFIFELTQLGFNNPEIILKLLYKFTDLIRINAIQKSSYETIKNRLIHRFNQKAEIKNSFNFVKKYIHNFLLYGKDKFLSSNEFMHNFDLNVLQKCLNYMNFQNSLIFIGGKSFKYYNETNLYNEIKNLTKTNYNHANFLDDIENYSKIKFREFNVQNNFLQSLNFNKPDFNLRLPNSNSYTIQKDKNWICKGLSNLDCKKKYKVKSLIPNLFYNKDGIEIWHFEDKSHLKESFDLNIKFDIKAFDYTNKSHFPLMKLFIIYFNYLWNEQMINLELTQSESLKINFSENEYGNIELFKWFSSKQMLKSENFIIDGFYINIKSHSLESFEKGRISEKIIKILDHKIEKDEFIFLKEELLRNIEIYISSDPTYQAFNWFFRLGFKYDIDYFSLTEEIKKITLNHFNIFKRDILKKFSVKALGYGSINKNQTEDMVLGIIKSFVKEKKIDDKNNKSPQSLSPMTSYIYKFPFYSYKYKEHKLFSNNSDFSLLNVYFLGKNKFKNLLKMKMLSNLAENVCISYLENKYQRGTIIKKKLSMIQDNLIFYIYVQGYQGYPKNINSDLNEVIKIIKDKINKVDEKTFLKIKNLVYKSLKIKHYNYNERHKMVWGKILNKKEIFEKNVVKITSKSITKHNLIEFLENMKHHKLTIHVLNKNEDVKKMDQTDNFKEIKSLDYFRSHKVEFTKKTLKSAGFMNRKRYQ